MSQWIDFKEMRSRLRFADVLDHYGIKLGSNGRDQVQGFCPLPSHQGQRRSPSFSANLERGIWQCFGCGAKGNVLDFAVRMDGLSPDQSGDVRATALRLAEKFQIGSAKRSRGRTQRWSCPTGARGRASWEGYSLPIRYSSSYRPIGQDQCSARFRAQELAARASLPSKPRALDQDDLAVRSWILRSGPHGRPHRHPASEYRRPIDRVRRADRG